MNQNLDLLRSKIEKGRNVGNDLNNNFSSDEKNRNFDEKIFFLEKLIFHHFVSKIKKSKIFKVIKNQQKHVSRGYHSRKTLF